MTRCRRFLEGAQGLVDATPLGRTHASSSLWRSLRVPPGPCRLRLPRPQPPQLRRLPQQHPAVQRPGVLKNPEHHNHHHYCLQRQILSGLSSQLPLPLPPMARPHRRLRRRCHSSAAAPGSRSSHLATHSSPHHQIHLAEEGGAGTTLQLWLLLLQRQQRRHPDPAPLWLLMLRQAFRLCWSGC